MLIDWFTVGAQILNFLILVWLMQRYLYLPILRAIDQREQRIARELADAAAKMAEAERTRDEYQQKTRQLDQQCAALLSQAAEQAQAERRQLLEAAGQAADALSTRRQEAFKNEVRNLNNSISRTMQQEVFSIARKALSELADSSIDERLAAVFTRRLAALDVETASHIAGILKTAAQPSIVRSAVELSIAQRAVLQNALNERFSADVAVRYETAADLISGIEWHVDGFKLAWTIADYISSLEDSVNALLPKQAVNSEITQGEAGLALPKADSVQ